MPQNPFQIGRGLMVLAFGPGADTVPLRFEIDGLGITFFGIEPRSQATSLFDLAKNRTPSLRKGSLSLASLPASPRDSFPVVGLDFSATEFTIRVAVTDPFCQRPNLLLRDLAIAFTVKKAEVNLVVSGTLTAIIAGHTVPLKAGLSDGLDIAFTPAGQDVPGLFPVGAPDFSTFRLRSNPDRWGGLQALYAFDEGAGNRARDTSGIDPAIDLVLQLQSPPGALRSPIDFSWIDGAMSIDPTRDNVLGSRTLIHAEIPPQAQNAPPQSRPLKRLIDAWTASGEITVEAWIRPIRAAQSGPATILAVSQDEQTRITSLSHGAPINPSGTLSVAQRTSGTATAGAAIATADNAATTNITYFVYTRDAFGNERIYLDGTVSASGSNPGRLFGAESMELVLGNELAGNRPWAGEYHRLAFYDRAMNAEKVRANLIPAFSVRASAEVRPDGVLGFGAAGAAVNTPSFDGRITIDGDRFALDGVFRLYPETSPLQVIVRQPVPFGQTAQIEFDGPAEVTLTDFNLFNPRLAFHGTTAVLRGTWLGAPAAFLSVRRGTDFVLAGTVQFVLPFSDTLPPITDEATGARLSGSINLQGNMNVSVAVELSASGFFAKVNASFAYLDDSQASHTISIPEFRLTSPPPTRNALLEHVLDELEENATALFADVLKNAADYYFSGEATAAEGTILLAQSASATQGNLSIVLPNVFAATQTVTVESSIFHLTQTTTSCSLTLNLTGQTADQIRTGYTAFVKALETPPAGATVLPGAVQMVLGRIAERLPMPFSLVPFYYYGLNTQQGSIDLQPGMRLRVEYQHYQLVHPSDRSGVSGFVGGSVAHYNVSSYPQSTAAGLPQVVLGFDGFLSNMPMTVSVDPSKGGAGGVLDLQQPGFRRAFYRLFYPSQFSPADSAAWTGSERVATLIGADSLAALRSASEAYLRDGAIPNTNAQSSFFFRGRAAVIPEIPIFVEERLQYVPIGTTVRHLLEAHSGIPSAGLIGENLSQFRGRIRPRRLIHEGVNGTPSYRYVDFDSYRTFSSRDIYDLPVVKGDRFNF